MIDYIIFGEFDINEGSVVRYEYPNKIGISDMILSSFLIPEGTHNIMTDSFCFIIKNSTNPEDVFYSTSKNILEKVPLNSTKYLNLENNLKNLNIENKIFKLKQIFTLDVNKGEWLPFFFQNNDINPNDKSKKYIPSYIINSTPSITKNQNIGTNISNNEKKLFLCIQKDSNKKFYRLDFFESSQENFFINSSTLPIYSIPIHLDFQFKKINSNFATFYTSNFQQIGIEFEDSDISLMEKLFDSEHDIFPDSNQDTQINYFMDDYSNYLNSDYAKNQKEFYFFCYLQTVLNKSTKRGAILKSISIGTSKLINLQNFSGLAKCILDQIFTLHLNMSIPEHDKLPMIKKLIENSYNSFNKIPLDFLIIPNNTRNIEAYLNTSSYFYNYSQDKENKIIPKKIKNIILDINTEKITFTPTLSDNQESLFPDCIEQFLSVFKEQTMIIYDALLTDKKIMFVGDSSTSCETLSKFVFTCVALVPIFGISKRLNPYKNLYDLDFLNSNNCVYAVTNPIFKMKSSYWDIMCEIDTGKVIFADAYKKIYNSQNRESDHFFIKEIIYKIKNESISEYEIKKYFKIYTFHLLKLGGEKYFIDDADLNHELNKQNKRKILLNNSNFLKLENELDKMRDLIIGKGVSLKKVIKNLENLYYRKSLNKEELFIIYTDIEKFMDCEYNINYVKIFQ